MQSSLWFDTGQVLEPQGSQGRTGEIRCVGMGVVTAELTPEDLEWIGQCLDDRDQLDLGWEELEGGRHLDWTPRDRFIEKFLKIRTKTENRAFFRLNPAQKEYSYRCSKQNVVLKARQVGITTYIAARFFVQTVTQPGTLSMQVTQDRESAEHIFRIVRRFWENLPDYLRKGHLRTSYRNTGQMVFPRLDSEYCLASAAENAGRGRTIQNLHCSEVSRWGREGDEALASLRAAVVPGGDIVLESTPNGAGGLFYEEWQRAEDTGYTQHFFPWWFEAAYALEPGANFLLTEEEKELADLHGLKPGQIAWRRKQWASLRGLAVQEFAEDPVSCFRASGECFFDLESIDQALKGSIEPLEANDNGRLKIWLPARPGREYVIGADTAGGGIEGDYSCAEAIDRQSGMQCAELHGHWSPREFARRVAELGKQYNGALVAVESNNHGHAVLACLAEPLKYGNVFRQNEKDGWLTTSANRPEMLENLSTTLIAEPGRFRSERLLNELRTFVRFANGNCGAAPGTHDDCVIAMAIAWAVRRAEVGRSAAVSRQPSAIRKGE